MVWVKSRTFETECWGYVQSILVEARGLMVRLELPEDHPSVQDAMNDGELDYDQVEIIDLVTEAEVEFVRKQFNDYDLRFWKRSITSAERAERARRRGFARLTMPELDHGLRR
jgi:hypothetical protein